MTETQRQIKELRKALPGLKEKVFGVALLLCLSLVMVASVSYAWVTMSTNPELGGVNTTVAANGALEVALADFDGEEPEESAAGDSFAATGQTNHNANTTWGNLVNLSSGYGIDNLVLRPAKLDLSKTSYLYSMKYGTDGRPEGIFSDFGFTTWYQTDKTTDTWAFVAPSNYPDVYANGDAYGVRAISSVTYEGNEDINVQKLRILSENQAVIKSRYEENLMGNEDYHAAIQELVNKYLAHTIDKAAWDFVEGTSYESMAGIAGIKDPGELENLQLDGNTFIPALTEMIRYFLEDVIIPTGETLVYTANLQQSETVYTLETLMAADRAVLLKQGVKLTALGYNASTNKYGTTNYYVSLYNTVAADLAIMQSLWEANGQPKSKFTWGEIAKVVDDLICMDQVTIYDKNGKGYRAGKFLQDAGGTDEAIDVVNNLLPQRPDIVSIKLVKGTLKDFEQLSGAAGELPVSVSVNKSAIVISAKYDGDGRITTNADHNNSYFKQDQNLAKAALDGAEDTRTLVAADTYGMILDLWVRTNAESSMLTLNGTPEVVEREDPLTMTIAGHDAPRYVYTYTYKTGQKVEVGGISVDETVSLEVYEVYHDPDGTGGLSEDYYYYYVADNQPVYERELKTQNGETGAVETTTLVNKNSVGLEQKTTTVYDVVGFTAANRIWQEDDADRPMPGAGEISTTQGSGSCYIFYADNDEEYENTKNLLKNMRLVFLDENGNELSRARLNTERIFPDNGKYTVPIEMESYKESITDDEGNVLAVGLCRLEKNVARRISVLVYLEGENLTNEMVMSKDSVVGSLNLQFDSTVELHSVGDTDLETEVIRLEASIDRTSWEYTGDAETAKLSAVIEGLTGQRVEAAFVRMYNSTQGTQGEKIELKQGADGYWTADIPFYRPGNYVLRALLIGGVEYPLAQPIEVTISGFDVGAAIFDTKAVMTVDQRTTKTVTIQLAGNVPPETLVAQFVTVDAKGNKSFVNASLNKIGSNWVGDAVFTKSGQYTLLNLIMDGETYTLPEAMQSSFMAYLGLTADVVLERYKKDDNGNYITDEYGNYVIDSLNYEYEGVEDIYVFVKIYDDAGVPMDTLGTVTLKYKPFGSAVSDYGFTTELTWNGTDYAGRFPANKAGRFVFGELLVGTEKIVSARSAPELSIISKEPPKVNVLGPDLAIGYTGGTAYYKVNIENAATANAWVVLSDGSQDHKLALTSTGENSYQAALPDRDGDANNGITNSNGNWTVKGFFFDNVYADDKFYANGEQYEIDVTDVTYTVVNYLTLETHSISLGGTSLATATNAFMTEQSLQAAGLSVTVKAPIGRAGSNQYVDPNLYKSSLSGVTVTLQHDKDSTKTYGGYTVSKAAAASNPTLTKQTIGTDGITFTLAEDTHTLKTAGKYTMTASVNFGGKEFKSGSGNVAEVYSKPVTVSIVSGSSGYSVSNASATSITVSKKTNSGSCGSSDTYDAPYVALKLEGRTDTSYTAELNFDATEKSKISKSSATGGGEGYSWTTGDTETRYLGTLSGNKESFTAAGTLNADKLTLTKDGDTYVFDVSITIINNG